MKDDELLAKLCPEAIAILQAAITPRIDTADIAWKTLPTCGWSSSTSVRAARPASLAMARVCLVGSYTGGRFPKSTPV
jgi:hypothetical protein